MRKTSFIAFLSAVTLLGVFSGCSKPKTPPVKERIAKIWTAQLVTYNGSTVYTKGATTNVEPNYTRFRLNLASPPTVQYTEYDGNTFVGQYSLPDDNTLTLTALTPQPSGTNGTITFTINEITDNSLKLTRTGTSQKTGGTTNVYTLSNP